MGVYGRVWIPASKLRGRPPVRSEKITPTTTNPHRRGGQLNAPTHPLLISMIMGMVDEALGRAAPTNPLAP